MLESHWNGSILDEIETALKFAEAMTYKGNSPVVKLITQPKKQELSLLKRLCQKLRDKSNILPIIHIKNYQI